MDSSPRVIIVIIVVVVENTYGKMPFDTKQTQCGGIGEKNRKRNKSNSVNNRYKVRFCKMQAKN